MNTNQWLWTRLLGTTNDESAKALTTGVDGAIYVAGYTYVYSFEGKFDGQTTINSPDAFITKYNPDGTKVWTRLLGTTRSNDRATALTTGSDGAIYVAGYTEWSGGGDFSIFDGQTKYGNDDAFITKYNPDGTKVWTRLLGGEYKEQASALTTGTDGAIYVAGYTTSNFDGKRSNGNDDAFITKYNPDGTKVWTQLLGSAQDDYAKALTTGSDGAIYVAGYTFTANTMDGQTTSSIYTPEVFLTKYNPDGTKVWTRLLGSTTKDGGKWDEAHALTTGIDGAIYVAGWVAGNMDNQTNSGGFDAFITKYNPDGTKVWTRLLGSTRDDFATSLTTGTDGAIYVAGYTDSSLDGQTANGKKDAFITKYNPDGTKVWTRLLGTTSNDQATALTSGNDNSIYVAGYTGDNLNGEIFNGKYFEGDVFITKFSEPTIKKSNLTVLVNKGILGPDPIIINNLVEEISSNGSTTLSHTVTYNGIQFNYADIDPLITTVVRDGNFTEEFRREISDLFPSLKDIGYSDAIVAVGITNIDNTLLYVAGADGNFVG